jgi:hypothetical protein
LRQELHKAIHAFLAGVIASWPNGIACGTTIAKQLRRLLYFYFRGGPLPGCAPAPPQPIRPALRRPVVAAGQSGQGEFVAALDGPIKSALDCGSGQPPQSIMPEPMAPGATMTPVSHRSQLRLRSR